MILKLLVCVRRQAGGKEKERENQSCSRNGEQTGVRGGRGRRRRTHVAQEVGVAVPVRPRRSLAGRRRCLRRGRTARGHLHKVRFGRGHTRFGADRRTHAG